MKVIFRADASLQIGTGHVMRCLTLADALTANGAECTFICREHVGNLIEHIKHKGYRVYTLPYASFEQTNLPIGHKEPTNRSLAHAAWLGATQKQDAAECTKVVEEMQPDWLVVDHYGLDAEWETALQCHYRKLMVIDDLADRPHISDLLLDQTFGRSPQAYQQWVPSGCTVLCGSQYALLRPEFSTLRPYSLKRRANHQLEHLLITMGGVDKDNATGQILRALKASELPTECRITVVMGANAPWLKEVRQEALQMPWPIEVLVDVRDMAQLMADSDIAIGAAGSTSWERCCLGLPTIMVVLAENQKTAAILLEQAQAVLSLSIGVDLASELQRIIEKINLEKKLLKALSVKANRITDGTGCQLVVSKLES
ncbi:UDP-2,4-diacetamido-2,4,6-trideoxy-beta-L-altropyranose hydrolase [Pseudomonas lini]|uniref:UDP-2,4-diacetamido-2,4, 6-trideoxy-beta-L-altropyranose hydrolase n=1 Tax=Pseudomonas lini TaxID=163011 RepID=UPI002784D445|nr:UDP-2,4-diacetamido-2,4,6-trideoxy-beta-L-altropyranose hydrolase [Pseudomonas lini]MDQ0125876.1 UDP-2,4-diacetamido-2,4,6-trideoxy-beta-L-altropyranose hydrolase [Pseudomonas lini]